MPGPAIGILGGTFDPVHYGHLRTGIEFRDLLDLQELRFVPCHRPPHRESPGASSDQRLAMLRLALADARRIVIDDLELRRNAPSYSVDTLRALRGELGRQVPLCLLIGSDAFNRLDTWKDWRQLTDLAHLVVADRPGDESQPGPGVVELLAQRQAESAQNLCDSAAGRILHCRFTSLEISASTIRAEHRAGRSLRYLLPAEVIDYIDKAGLYCGSEHGPGSNH